MTKQDFTDLLERLNQARKDVWYEGDESALDLDDTLAEVEELVEAAIEEDGT